MTTPSVGSALRKAKSYATAGELARAQELYQTILTKYPGNKQARQAIKRLPNAMRSAASVSPDQLEAVFAHLKQGNSIAASAAAAKLAETYPDSAAVWNINGIVQGQLGNAAQAEAFFSKAIALNPRQAEFWYNKGMCLEEAGRHQDARSCYASALDVDPKHIGAAKKLGDLLQGAGDLSGAVEAYRIGLSAQPKHALLNEQIGHCFFKLGQFGEARTAYRIAASGMPDQGSIWAQIDLCTRRMCDWESLDEVAAECLLSAQHAAPPWGALMRADDPALQLQLSRAFAQRVMPNPECQVFESDRARNARLRVGFFGADFHTHATLHLMSGLLRAYDRAQFEFVVFSYGTDEGGAARAAVESNVDAFYDVAGRSDAQITSLVLEQELDIAIDLKGFTFGGRSELFTRRLAPVHLNYLGYPGSLGSTAFDYIVADSVVIPTELEAAYDERILRLPGCFQPNDNQRVVGTQPGRRADHGLQETGFVFCNFNHAAKIGPREFDLWMGLLRDVPQSQLWLLEDNTWSTRNLRAAAQARGVDPARLVFAPRMEASAHLARHCHADLFLDSLTCTAHTTAADALWAGLPLVTCQGDQFAARVASSLLAAAGLEDLITANDAAYADLARALAQDTERLRTVRERVADARGAASVFDTETYAKDFGRGLKAVFEQWQSGQPPANITIGSQE